VVAARYLDPGALVHAQTPIVRLISADELRVRFAISEDEALRFAPAVRIRARVAASGMQLDGTVESIAPEVDTAARMIFAEARLDPPAAGIRPPAVWLLASHWHHLLDRLLDVIDGRRARCHAAPRCARGCGAAGPPARSRA
jgi:multidrug efflux pump subunit AcrA (membrane-fusion protein)